MKTPEKKQNNPRPTVAKKQQWQPWTRPDWNTWQLWTRYRAWKGGF